MKDPDSIYDDAIRLGMVTSEEHELYRHARDLQTVEIRKLREVGWFIVLCLVFIAFLLLRLG